MDNKRLVYIPVDNNSCSSWILIKSTHDRWNHRTGFGKIGPGFEVSCWRLAVSLSWWISWLITMNEVEFIHMYFKTWWEEFRATDDAGIRLVYNPSAAFENNLLYHAEISNNCLESCYIIVGVIRRTKKMIALTWGGQCSWGFNIF